MSDTPVWLIPFVRRPPNCVLILQASVVSQHSDVSSISHRWRSSVRPFYYYFNFYVHSMLSPPFSHLPPIFHFLYARYNLLTMEGKHFQYFCLWVTYGSPKSLVSYWFFQGFHMYWPSTTTEWNSGSLNQNLYCGKLQWSEVSGLPFFFFQLVFAQIVAHCWVHLGCGLCKL